MSLKDGLGDYLKINFGPGPDDGPKSSADNDGDWVLEEGEGVDSVYQRLGWVAVPGAGGRTEKLALARRFTTEIEAIEFKCVRSPHTRKTFIPTLRPVTDSGTASAPKTIPSPPPAFEGCTTYLASDGTELLRVTESGGVYVRGQLATSPIDVADAMRAYCSEEGERAATEIMGLRRELANAVRENGTVGRDFSVRIDVLAGALDKGREEISWYRRELNRHDPRVVAAHERNDGK